jgi:hypothetical protein
MKRVNRGGRKGLRVIEGDISRLESEFLDALIEFVVCDAKDFQRTHERLCEVNARVAHRGELRLVGTSVSPSSDANRE